MPACQSIVKKAIVKRLMNGHKVGTLPEDGALYKIRFALRKDTVEIYLDTSGDGLHKRGYRKNATLAPIKETLAAAIADLGRVRRDSLVQDPFCGSGTLVIEAAQKALNLAPGLRRRFAAEHFDFVPATSGQSSARRLWPRSARMPLLRASATTSTPPLWRWPTLTPSWPAWGTAAALRLRTSGIYRALDNATVLTNPPYGERLGDASEAASLARTLGQVWQAHPAQGLYAITADADFEQHFGKKAARRRKIYNGMIPCQLYMYFEQPKRERK